MLEHAYASYAVHLRKDYTEESLLKYIQSGQENGHVELLIAH